VDRQGSFPWSLWPHRVTNGEGDSLVKKEAGRKKRRGKVEGTKKIKGHCCLFESREKCLACVGGRSPSERRQWAGGRQPWDDPIPSTTGPGGIGGGRGRRWWRKPAGASGSRLWKLWDRPATVCLCHPVCSPSSSRSRSFRSMVATGPGSDSTGSTVGHTGKDQEHQHVFHLLHNEQLPWTTLSHGGQHLTHQFPDKSRHLGRTSD
jgi:hypothetical protein